MYLQEIKYPLSSQQKSLIRKKIIPMLETLDDDIIIWNNESYHKESVKIVLEGIIDSGEYNQRQADLLDDLIIVYQEKGKT